MPIENVIIECLVEPSLLAVLVVPVFPLIVVVLALIVVLLALIVVVLIPGALVALSVLFGMTYYASASNQGLIRVIKAS